MANAMSAEVKLEGGQGSKIPLEFGRSVNPIEIRGADYALHTFARELRDHHSHYL